MGKMREEHVPSPSQSPSFQPYTIPFPLISLAALDLEANIFGSGKITSGTTFRLHA